MPFVIPSEAQEVARIQADLASRLPGADPLLPRSVAGAYATVLGGATVGVYEFTGWLARQLFDATAEAEFLERRGGTFGLHRKPPSYAQGPVPLTGSAGTLPAGSVLQRGDGQQYVTQADATLVAGAATVLVQSVTPGAAGNMAAGGTLTITPSAAGFTAACAVPAAAISAGNDQESDDDLRARLIQRRQQPPQGGASADYVAWAELVPGVTRVWVMPGWMGPGTVGVTFVMDDRAATGGSIIPAAADVAAVLASIAARAPVTAVPVVFAPTPVQVALAVTLVPNTTATRAAVSAALADLFARESVPGGLIYRSHIDQAIADTPGIIDHTVTAIAGVAPANIVMTPGQIAQLGVPVFSG